MPIVKILMNIKNLIHKMPDEKLSLKIKVKDQFT